MIVNLPNFDNEEIMCKCGCKLTGIDPNLMINLQAFRNMISMSVGYAVRFIITSGVRCAEHNKNVGGVKGSQHTKGNAVDLWSPDVDLEQLYSYACMSNLFTTIILYSKTGFVHVDNRDRKKSFWEWDK